MTFNVPTPFLATTYFTSGFFRLPIPAFLYKLERKIICEKYSNKNNNNNITIIATIRITINLHRRYNTIINNIITNNSTNNITINNNEAIQDHHKPLLSFPTITKTPPTVLNTLPSPATKQFRTTINLHYHPPRSPEHHQQY